MVVFHNALYFRAYRAILSGKTATSFRPPAGRKPVALFECKMSDSKPSSELLKLSRQLGDLPCVQLLRHCPKDIRQGNCLVTQADRYLANLV